MTSYYSPESYRSTSEYAVLALTLLVILAGVVISAVITVCGSLIFIPILIFMAYASSKAHHQTLMHRAYPVSRSSLPQIYRLIKECETRLRPGPIQAFVTPNAQLNAYTFGLEDPKVIVMYSSLFEVMDDDEMRFIIGHELGHVALGHTWLNSLVGGMAGVPSTSMASMLMAMALLWWNRTCEMSADRAGLLVCGKPEKAITSLVKLVAGPQARSQAALEAAYRQIDAEDDTIMGPLAETMDTHPMLIRRINEIRRYAASAEYQRLRSA